MVLQPYEKRRPRLSTREGSRSRSSGTAPLCWMTSAATHKVRFVGFIGSETLFCTVVVREESPSMQP